MPNCLSGLPWPVPKPGRTNPINWFKVSTPVFSLGSVLGHPEFPNSFIQLLGMA